MISIHLWPPPAWTAGQHFGGGAAHPSHPPLHGYSTSYDATPTDWRHF